MTTNEKNELEYFVEDEVIEAVQLNAEPIVQLVSDEELFRACDDALNRVLRK